MHSARPKLLRPTPLVLCALLLIAAAAFARDSESRGGLLVTAMRKLFLIRPDGSAQFLARNVVLAAFSPDARQVAYTTRAENLFVLKLETGATQKIAKVPLGAYFGQMEWSPDGKSVAYEMLVHGTDDHLFLAAIPSPAAASDSSDAPAARDLGPWSHGFSFSRDGKEILHPVDAAPGSAFELLDLATGKRTLLHKVNDVVSDARFSPDGQFIAYRVALHLPSQPPQPFDPSQNQIVRNADCAIAHFGLRVYSLASRSDFSITIHGAPANWDDVVTFAWAPDSRSLALTLAEAGCDYPGKAAGVFLTTLDSKSQRLLSTTPKSFEPAFSPDGSAIAFVDSSQSLSKLFRCNLSTGQVTLLRSATPSENYYRLLAWR
jgi:dipeptidyl aminopeptidase/acylaminoacyl peptidase